MLGGHMTWVVVCACVVLAGQVHGESMGLGPDTALGALSALSSGDAVTETHAEVKAAAPAHGHPAAVAAATQEEETEPALTEGHPNRAAHEGKFLEAIKTDKSDMLPEDVPAAQKKPRHATSKIAKAKPHHAKDASQQQEYAPVNDDDKLQEMLNKEDAAAQNTKEEYDANKALAEKGPAADTEDGAQSQTALSIQLTETDDLTKLYPNIEAAELSTADEEALTAEQAAARQKAVEKSLRQAEDISARALKRAFLQDSAAAASGKLHIPVEELEAAKHAPQGHHNEDDEADMHARKSKGPRRRRN